MRAIFKEKTNHSFPERMLLVARLAGQVRSIFHGAVLLSRRCATLKAVLLYYLDEMLSSYKMYIDILPTHCSYM